MNIKAGVYKSFGRCSECLRWRDNLTNALCSNCYYIKRAEQQKRAKQYHSALHIDDFEFILHKVSELNIRYNAGLGIKYDGIEGEKIMNNIELYQDEKLVDLNYHNLDPIEILDFVLSVEKQCIEK